MLDILEREFIYLWYYFDIQLRQIFWYWVLGMALGSAVSVFLKDHIHDTVRSLGQKKLGVLGVGISSILGIASPLCMYGTIPIAASFSRSGVRDDWLAAFMMSSILLNPQLILYSAALGSTVLAVRIVSCFLCGIMAGLCVRWFYKGKSFFNFSGFEEPKSKDTDTEHNRPIILTDLKTKAAERNIPLPDRLAECLKEAKKKSTSDYVVANRDGEPLSYTQFKQFWKYIVTRTAKPRIARKPVNGKYEKYMLYPELGEKARNNSHVVYSLDFEVTPHMLRHTYITNLIHSSVDPKTVQYLAGHKSSKITGSYPGSSSPRESGSSNRSIGFSIPDKSKKERSSIGSRSSNASTAVLSYMAITTSSPSMVSLSLTPLNSGVLPSS